jgi:hypothetical protein
MEATGVYWKPVWHILDGRFGLGRVLINPAQRPLRFESDRNAALPRSRPNALQQKAEPALFDHFVAAGEQPFLGFVQ